MTHREIRVVMHAHSEWSYDAHWPLPRVARLMERLGAEAVMMSEHDTGFDPDRFAEYRAACAAASTPRCTVIPGIEYSSPDNTVHLPSWGLDRFLGEHRPTGETLARIADAGGASIFAHPVRREAWRIFDMDWVPHLAAIEIWNRKTDGIAPGLEAQALAAQARLPGVAGLDFHRRNQIWPLMNTLRIDPALPLEAALVEALRDGRVTPVAFGRRVSADPASRHHRAERLRRGLKRVLRR